MYLITGAAGFIGFHLSLKLLQKNENVIGVDNINNYYDKKIKYDRIKILKKFPKFKFFKIDLNDKKYFHKRMKKYTPNKHFVGYRHTTRYELIIITSIRNCKTTEKEKRKTQTQTKNQKRKMKRKRQ